MNNLIFIGLGLCLLTACQAKEPKAFIGKIKRETVTFAPKVTGRILKLYVDEGQAVKPGDTLAILDIPEVNAKMAQALGAFKAASAQQEMADNGFTQNQLKQLRAKYTGVNEQFALAQKSFNRAFAIFKDSLMSPQAFDETYAKYQGAKAQLDAVTAELQEAEKGTRHETILATVGQREQAEGLVKEAEIAYSERYIIATNYMTVETIVLREGELAAAGHPVFSGYISNSTWFRFTIPESKIGAFQKGQDLQIEVPYRQQTVDGTILTIKQMPRYADITTAYPDYEMDDAIYEIKIKPKSIDIAEELFYNATIRLKPFPTK